MVSSSTKGTKKVTEVIVDIYIPVCGPGSSVGIANGYGMDGPGNESR